MDTPNTNPHNAPPSTEPPQPTEARDLGFGTKALGRDVRLMNPDGTANVVKLGRPWFRPYDFYLNLISMSWLRFTAYVFLFYLCVNLIFSCLYLVVGLDQLAGLEGKNGFERFMEAFFFSSQTVTTLGYGRIAPVGTAASMIAAVESLVGLLGFALATGLLYGRFSRAEAKIKFSEHAVVAPYEGGRGLMLRLANERSSNLIEVEAVVTIAYFEPGNPKREYDRLDLEVDKITFLALSWTLVHPIKEGSPIHGWTYQDYIDRQVEFIVLIKAFDDSFGSTVYQRKSYTAQEVRWGEKFKVIMGSDGKAMTLDLGRIGDSEKMDLPG